MLTQWKSTFWRFCMVGLSGVFVNLSCLALFKYCGLDGSTSSACAIEISIISNFIVNDWWTFNQHQHDTYIKRFMRFQVVSLGGGLIQWNCFIVMNLVWLYLGLATEPWDTYWHHHTGASAYLHTPDVGYYLYVSQLIGVAVATVWNFLLNFYWTWAVSKRETSDTSSTE